jgi:amino acid transporter
MSGETSLRRSLSTRDLIVYGLLFIGPTAPMGVFGVLDAQSNGATALVFVIATIAMGFTAWSYARMSAVVPRAGSVAAYAAAGLGRFPGFLAGWLAGLDYMFIPSVAALFTGIATHSLVPAIPQWLTTGVAILVFTGLNLAGVRIAARVGLVVLAVEIVLLAVFAVGAIVVLAHYGPTRGWLSPLTGVGTFAPTAVLGAVSVAVLSFLGFDAIAGFAEENTGSPRQIGRALLFCLVLAGVLFIAQSYLADLISTLTPAQLNADASQQGAAFYTIIRTSIGGWFGTTVSAVKAVGPVFAALVAQAAASRLLYGMAQQRLLPGWLGRVDRRTHTPVVAILVSAAATLVIAVWAATQANGLDVLSSMVTVGALTAFVLLHASVVGYFLFRARTERFGVWVLVPVVGAAINIVLLVEASHLALIVAGVWLVIGLVLAAGLRIRGRGVDVPVGEPGAAAEQPVVDQGR